MKTESITTGGVGTALSARIISLLHLKLVSNNAATVPVERMRVAMECFLFHICFCFISLLFIFEIVNTY
jgi:hypothetical protein